MVGLNDKDLNTRGMIHIRDSEYWNHLMGEYVYSPAKAGCKILVQGVDSRLGIGKTSFALSLAYEISDEVGWELTEDDVMLSANHFLKRYKEHPGVEQPSVMVLDEVIGAGGGDSRRSMSNRNVNMARTFEIMRKKRIILIMTAADFFSLDSRMKRLLDYVWMIQTRPRWTGLGYQVKTEFGTGAIRLKRLTDGHVYFYSMDGCPLLDHLDRQKDLLLESEAFDFDNIGGVEKKQIDFEKLGAMSHRKDPDPSKVWNYRSPKEV